MPRKNELVRQTEYATKTIAANIDSIIVVCAVEPEPSLELIDHYIVAAELLPAETIIVINKTDLINAKTAITSLENKYHNLAYPIIDTCKTDLSSLNTLANQLINKTCIFVGQSGVGKSTLINALIPELKIETQSISDQIFQGRHTTSTTTLYDLHYGGELIDSPGVREFSAPKLDAKKIMRGFVEIYKMSKKCKFHDCKHINEPQCAVKLAVEKNNINAERYFSYKNLIEQYI